MGSHGIEEDAHFLALSTVFVVAPEDAVSDGVFAGFVGCDAKTVESFAVAADARGHLMPGNGSHYLGGKLFSAGDMRTGQSLVVRALADGRAAVQEIHLFLSNHGQTEGDGLL